MFPISRICSDGTRLWDASGLVSLLASLKANRSVCLLDVAGPSAAADAGDAGAAALADCLQV